VMPMGMRGPAAVPAAAPAPAPQHSVMPMGMRGHAAVPAAAPAVAPAPAAAPATAPTQALENDVWDIASAVRAKSHLVRQFVSLRVEVCEIVTPWVQVLLS